MSGKSLRLRLVLAGMVAVVLAVMAAGFAMVALFERHVERAAIADANLHLDTLIAGAVQDKAGKPVFPVQPIEDVFAKAYSGHYWQAQSDGKVVARSRSLWDFELALPKDDVADGGRHVHVLGGPRQSDVLAIERSFILNGEHGPKRYVMVVAHDRTDIIAARDEFARSLAVNLALLALALIAASLSQIYFGLKPLDAIRTQLLAIRSGVQPRLPNIFPAEVTPLAAEINALLDERDSAVERARGRAADLAHGLKTPLTALGANARRLQESGQATAADEISNLAAMMERHVHRELTRARIGGGARGAIPIRPVVELVAAAVARTPDAQGKGFEFDIDPAMTLRIDRADLEELVGNLIENAARHARSIVRIAASEDETGARLAFDDDGAGVDGADHARLLRRGERLDSSGQGNGLGLSIAADIVEAYGGQIAFARSDLGGLSVVITLTKP